MTEARRLPEFFHEWRKGWSDPEALQPENYLDEDAALKVVVMSQWLFAPEFIEIRGGIYRLHDATAKNVDHWLDGRPDMKLADVEELLNTLHLWTVFANCDLEGFDDALDDLARSIGSAWRGALAERFPGHDFTVLVDDTATGPYGPGVTFFWNRGESA